jgi:hypothetical protein
MQSATRFIQDKASWRMQVLANRRTTHTFGLINIGAVRHLNFRIWDLDYKDDPIKQQRYDYVQ